MNQDLPLALQRLQSLAGLLFSAAGRKSCFHRGHGQKKAARNQFRTAFLKSCWTLVTAATAISAITTATIATVSTATTTAATATVAAAATTTAAAFALLHRARFVHGQRTAIDFLAVKLRDGRLSFVSGAHFHEAKTAGTSGHAIIDQLDPRDVARLGKQIGQVVFRHAKGQVAHIQFHTHLFLWDGSLMSPDRIYAATELKLT
jgi:hypothetical protein